MKRLLARIHPIAFFSSLGLLIAAVLFSILDSKGFYAMTSSANDWLIANFGGVFSITGLLTVAGCLVAYFSPL